MSKHIQLSIDNPCHENWDKMSPSEKGRFCDSCQKQVIDFTNMSDSQVAAFFKKPSTGSVCGRFYSDQLERDIEIPKKRIPWVKYFFQFALPAFLFSMKATAQGKVKTKIVAGAGTIVKPGCNVLTGFVAAQKRIVVDTTLSPFQKQEKNVLLTGKPLIRKEPVPISLLIKGRIVDADNNPVPYATIMVKGTRLGTMADSTGTFKVERPGSQKEIILLVSSVGFNEKEMPVNHGTDLAKDLLIQLNRRALEEVSVVAYPSMVVGKLSVAQVTSKKEEKKPSKDVQKVLTSIPTIKPLPEDAAMIKVYPNPVLSGTNINIGCQRLKEGYYTVQLTDPSGQQLLNKQTWIDGEIQVLNIDIPHVAAGVYFLKLTNKETTKRFTQKIIIE